MRRTVALILALCFAVLGTGVVQHLHDLQHASKALPGQADNCPACLALHQPVMAQSFAPPLAMNLVSAGAHRPAPMVMVESLRIDRLDCRGPPGCSHS